MRLIFFKRSLAIVTTACLVSALVYSYELIKESNSPHSYSYTTSHKQESLFELYSSEIEPISTSMSNLTKNYKYGRRGLAILALLHKNFPVEEAYEVLRESDRPAFSFLYGKYAFGDNPENYYRLMSMFLEEGRSVHVEIYTLCGACRPPRISNMNLASFCRSKSVNKLQKAFISNPKTRRKYKTWLKKIKSTFVDPYPEMTFTLTISLEDNDAGKWAVVKQKVKGLRSVFKKSKNVKLARNAVGELPYGYGKLHREIHTTLTSRLDLLWKGDIVSFDGDYFNFPGEDVSKNPGYSRNNRSREYVPNFAEIKRLVKQARKDQLDLYVWRFEFQGLDTDKRIHPRKRNYRILGKKYLKQLMRLK